MAFQKTIFLGLDIGTSGCKIASFDDNGTELQCVMEEYPTHYLESGRVEQDPDDWWGAVTRGLNKLWDSGINPHSIAAVSVAGQSWSAIPIGEKGDVLARTPIWMDVSSEQTCRLWSERISTERIFKISGNPFSPTYTLPKVLHWMRTAPALIERARYILQSNSFIVFRLTGETSMDNSMSYAWHNFDQSTMRYDRELTKEFGIPERFLIDPVACEKIAGHVTSEAARLTGLVEGTPVVAGGLDAACSSYGVGVTVEGQTQEQGGQAGGMSICVSEPISHPKLILGAHVVPGKWLLQGGSVGGGASLRWFAKTLGAEHGNAIMREGSGIFKALDKEAEESRPGSNGVVFLPYFAGERSPIWDTDAKGMYFGLRFANTHKDLVRATMEGVAYSLRHNIETAEDVGAKVTELRATGGSANSRIWTQIKSDATGLKMLVPASDTATTLGAAMLAMVGVGRYSDHGAAAETIVKIRREHKPDETNKRIYDEYFEIYKALYENTAYAMKRISYLERKS